MYPHAQPEALFLRHKVDQSAFMRAKGKSIYLRYESRHVECGPSELELETKLI